jgi:broad specificity phosphatase PhoE
MSVQKVFLIRHGETDFNRNHRLQGSMPVPLNANGHLQAEALGLYLKHHPIDALFSSPLTRARQTADLIGQALNLAVQDEPRMGEIAFGDKFEGLTMPDIKEKYPDEYRMWKSGDLSYVVPNGESRHSVQKRMTDAWEDLTSNTDYETIALVSHGSALKIFLRSMFHYLPTSKINNTSITTLSRFNRVWEIEAFAETPHLTDI